MKSSWSSIGSSLQQAHNQLRLHAWLRYIVAAVLFALGLLIRHLVFAWGWIYGTNADIYSGIVAAALLVLLLWWALQPTSTSSADESTLPRITVVLGLAAAAVATIQLFAPATPREAVTSACRGTPIVGADFLAQTGEKGANARRQATNGSVQVNRFPAGCTLGFDGFCIGQPVKEPISEVNDTRWFILHQRDHLVSSAKLLDQNAVSELGDKPDSRCPTLGGRPAPTQIKFDATSRDNGVSLTTSGKNVEVVGYAFYFPNPVDQTYPYVHFKLKDTDLVDGEATPNFPVTWDAGYTAKYLPQQSGSVIVGASACLAADNPIGPLRTYRAELAKGTVMSLEPNRLPTARVRATLQRIACAGRP